MEDEIEEVNTFNYFNSDINLLALHILLEGFYRGENTFKLEEFLKCDYWKIDEINEEIKDTNDYGSVEDLVLHQIIRIVNDFKLGKVKRISITTIFGLTETVVRSAIGEKEATEENVLFYTNLIDEIGFLRRLKETQLKEKLDSGIEYQKIPNRVDFTEENFTSHFENISAISAPFIEFEIDFNDKGAHEADEGIEDYVVNFADDQFIDKKPFYREKRYYYTKQLESFFDYISKIIIVNGYIKIPFSALSEQGFEIVKILSYLERQRRLKVSNWNDNEVWNVKFHKTPITLRSLLGQEDQKEIENTEKNEILKFDLSFSPEKSVLNIGKYIIGFRKFSDQYHLIKIITDDTNNLNKEWFFSEIGEIFDSENNFEDKKFYNASYQISQKIAKETGIKDFLITTAQTVQFNPKYIKS